VAVVRIKLRDVALRAGVSEATVSRVVNDKPGVNDTTRVAVRQVLDELGYGTPTNGRRSGLVGLIVPELDNPIFPAFAQTIETRLAIAGYTAVLCTATQEGVFESEYLDKLLARDVTGIVVVSGLNADTTADHSVYRDLVARGVPMVFLNGVVDDLAAPFVSCDDRNATQLAVGHLLSLGHRRIGLITGARRYSVVQRKVEGFETAMRDADLYDPQLVTEALFTVEGGHVAARTLLRRKATAIVASSDLMALGAIRACSDQGLDVPGDVSVVGFDDTPLMAFTDPPLTTVRQPVRQMSGAAVDALLAIMGGKGDHAGEYVFRPELVVRGSTAPAPSRSDSRPSQLLSENLR
jgi:LacI family transcriptional regulator, repressor for deo operon, udp, cdd, tsx, nupC, and nupG